MFESGSNIFLTNQELVFQAARGLVLVAATACTQDRVNLQCV